MTTYDVIHRTEVRYGSPVRLAQFNLRLMPAPWPGQSLESYMLEITPAPTSTEEDFGPFLVNRTRLAIRDPLSKLEIECHFQVTVENPGFVVEIAAAPGGAPGVVDVRDMALARADLGPDAPAGYLFPSVVAGVEPEIGAWARPMLDGADNVVAAGKALMEAIYREFRYDPDATEADTGPAEAFAAKRGVCQDFAHVMIVAARAHGIPAAYVSGYLRTIPPPGRPRLVGADAMHAWVALWCGDALGWIGFDPTNAVLASNDHIFVAMGRDYADVAPLVGVFHGGSGQRMKVAVDVIPVE